MAKRVFLIVLDSAGIGAANDAARFHDAGCDTMGTCVRSDRLHVPNMEKLGLFRIDGTSFRKDHGDVTGCYGRLVEKSAGKDTTVGHWELAGVISQQAMPTYPQGFPREVMAEFERRTGRGTLCNLPYSGSEVIKDYGQEHIATGKLIVYTSADSVFQIAAHEAVVPVQELYRHCQTARDLLQGEHGVGRVIARPFVGDAVNGFKRTSNRHDYSLEPPAETMLDAIKAAGLDSIAVGKIHDIFAGYGDTEYVYNTSNANGMEHAVNFSKKDFHGLCFVNLVDFDMQYGHRRDIDGYANALTEFDGWLKDFLPTLGEEDLVMITADHGCDPAYTATTDHTREYVPLLVLGKQVKTVNMGTRVGFADIAATVTELLGVEYKTTGKSFAKEIL